MSEQSDSTVAAIADTSHESALDDGRRDPDAQPAAASIDIARLIEETVSRTLASLGVTAGTAEQQRGELELLVAPLARAPEEMKARLDSVCAMLIDRLEDPKGLILYNRQRRLFLDLLALHDLIRDLETGVETLDPDSPPRSNYRNLNEQLLQLLTINGVTPIVVVVGAPFNAQQHRVIRVVPTDDASQDGCIDAIVRDGFVYGPFVVRPTEVVVRKGQR